jgi:hypothetical protein
MVDQKSVGQRPLRNQLNLPQAAERTDEGSFSESQQVYLNQLARLEREATQDPKFAQPPFAQLNARARQNLVGSVLGPRPGIPPTTQRRPRLPPEGLGPPPGLVAVEQPLDLRRPLRERADERCQLIDLPRSSMRVPISDQRSRAWVR